MSGEKKMKKLFIIALVLVAGQIFAQTKTATTAANFLTIPVSPRASAMGGAFTAIANDASALYWNPGGLAKLTKSEFSVAYSEWLVKTNYNWMALAYKMDDVSAIGFSINQLNYGEEDVTNELYPNGTGEKWNAQDIAIGLSYSRSLTDRFSIGGTVKYIRQQIWHESASAFALDIGLLFQTELEGLKLGMNITNFGSEMKLDGKDLYQPIDIDRQFNSGNNENVPGSLNVESWPLPLVFAFGCSYEAIHSSDMSLILDVDAVYPSNQSSYLNAGAEFGFMDVLFLRIGRNSIFKQSAEETMSYGAGFKYDFGPVSSKIDYCNTGYGRFGNLSKVSLTIGF